MCAEKELVVERFRELQDPPQETNFSLMRKTSTVVIAVGNTLGSLSEDVEKALRVAMMAMTQTATALKERKLDASNPAITKLQGETPPTLLQPWLSPHRQNRN